MSKALYQESIVEKGSTEKKELLSQWLEHYCEISISWIGWSGSMQTQNKDYPREMRLWNKVVSQRVEHL